jgi:prolyl oligopeptidase
MLVSWSAETGLEVKMTSRRLWLVAAFLIACGCGATAPAASRKEPTAAARPAAPSPAPTVSPAPPPEDPYLALEEIEGAEALAFARKQNEKSTAELAQDPSFAPLDARLRGILDSKDKIPWLTKRAKYFYNFWRDEAHPRGLWRRLKSLDDYTAKEPKWEILIDLDALAKGENENWVWAGAECLYPQYQRCLLQLSRGGSDAVVVREFDTVKKRFIEDGFNLPEAKSDVAWKDRDTIYVGTDFGEGSLTESGYPRLTKEWRRGAKLEDADLIYECRKEDMYCLAYRDWDHGAVRDFVQRKINFYEQEIFLRRGAQLVPIPVPISAETSTWDDQLLIQLRDDWETDGRTWPKGSLLAAPLEPFLEGKREITALFTPAANLSLVEFTSLKSALVLAELEDVRSKATVWTRRGGAWRQDPFAGPDAGTFGVNAVEPNDSDAYWLVATDFTLPTTLSFGSLRGKARRLKQSPAFFDATGLVVEQHFATSKDGTRIPYFQVMRRTAALDGRNPTLLYGYGGFEISIEAAYDAETGAAWLERGGVYVAANIRGGGEYGPSWHQAAVKENRQRAFDDFIAVAEDLVARKVTAPEKLGIVGGSNGGLLMGVMLTQRPDLFGAIVCRVPLLDMKRYHTLLAGASWMAEYGDPDVPEEWAYISRYSPYQNVRADAKYPRTLFTTSTRDDRVHPGHARKMVARMLEQGHDVLYYENIEGGHGGSANNEQRAYISALVYTFLARQLGLPAKGE